MLRSFSTSTGRNIWTRAVPVSLAAHALLTLLLFLSFPSSRQAKPLPPLRAYQVSLSIAPAPKKPPGPKPLPKGVTVQPAVPKPPPQVIKPEPEKPKPDPVGPEGSSLGSSGSSSGVSQIEGGNFNHGWYLESVQRKISQSWMKPHSLSGVRGDAIIYFRIHLDGRTSGAKVHQKSGSNGYDMAAMRAVLTAAPYPPLPKGFSGEFIGVYFTFLKHANL